MTLRGVLLGLALSVVTALVAGCGTASAPSPPAGVDGLTIPTPSPEQADFRRGVDHPWLPLAPGNRWTYDVTDATGTHRLRVRPCGEQAVDGVVTTRLCSQQGRQRTTDLYAEDDAGNVWWFGRSGEWTAGVGGAEPGLLLAATPRVGDGYAVGGGARATVESVTDRVTVPAGSFDDVVTLDVVPASGAAAQWLYARGVGPVEQVSPDRVVRLVSFRTS